MNQSVQAFDEAKEMVWDIWTLHLLAPGKEFGFCSKSKGQPEKDLGKAELDLQF